LPLLSNVQTHLQFRLHEGLAEIEKLDGLLAPLQRGEMRIVDERNGRLTHDVTAEAIADLLDRKAWATKRITWIQADLAAA